MIYTPIVFCSLTVNLFNLISKENKRTWKQDYAAIYDGETKSVKLVYWKDYVENYLPFDIKARETMQKKQNQKGKWVYHLWDELDLSFH